MLSKVKGTLVSKRLESYLSDRTLITDLICKLTITFGVVLIVGGLYLMITASAVSTQAFQTYNAVKSTVDTINWIPGIPFYIGDLLSRGATIVGVVSWILGIDLLLLGLGLWVRHRFARFAAFAVFGLAAIFQFIQFLILGAMGSPSSIVEFLADAIIIYFLLFRFDSTIYAKSGQIALTK
jgi:hypothetical protein